MSASTIRRLFGIAIACVVASTASRALEAQRAPATPPNIIAIGCIAQLPDSAAAPPTGHEQGAAMGLTLTRATVKSTDGRGVDASPRSAVPGSVPSGRGSGTTDAAAPRQTAPVEQSFWLVGAKSAELTRFVGKRVEVTGTFDERLAANPGTTSATAHPSAPSRAISAVAFRVLNEGC